MRASTPEDLRVIAGQIGRHPEGVLGLARPCSYGTPRVVLSHPLHRHGGDICGVPHNLLAQLPVPRGGRVQPGDRRGYPKLARSYDQAHEAYRRERLALLSPEDWEFLRKKGAVNRMDTGIAGLGNPMRVKYAQLATSLPGGEPHRGAGGEGASGCGVSPERVVCRALSRKSKGPPGKGQALSYNVFADMNQNGYVDTEHPVKRIRNATQLFGISLAVGLLLSRLLWFNLVFVAAGLVTAVYAGRVFCGWLCPLGAILDRLPKRSNSRTLRLHPVVRYALLVTFLGGLTFLFLRPVVPVPPSILLMGAMFVGASIFALVWSSRAWCGWGCPWGTLQDLLSRWAQWRLAIQGDCRGCRSCARACPVGGLLEPTIEARRWADPAPLGPGCIRCLECQAACPAGAIRFISRRKEPARSSTLTPRPSRGF